MKELKRSILGLLAITTLSACSGMGTTMTRVGRLGENRGYEISAELPLVQQATLDVLKTRGYEVSVKPQPANGPGGAGQVVIGQRTVKYSAAPGSAVLASASSRMDTRDLVDVYLSKKWRVSDNLPVLNITLVDIVGSSYLKKGDSAEEVETPVDKEFVAQLRDEIERKVNAGRDAAPAAK